MVAGPTCQTQSLSDLLDEVPKPLILHVKIYVRNNTRFFGAFRLNSENTILPALDVVSLYINISHAYGLESINTLVAFAKYSINNLY